MGRLLVDLTGKRFGRWMVLAIHPKRVRYGRRRLAVQALWLCRCDCGTERLMLGSNLRCGVSTSCGCFKREQTIKRNLKHGHARRGNHTRIYDIWVSMLQRCLNPNAAGYRNYGGRGITVCERWLIFKNFYVDMGDPPPGLSLDRINNDGNYDPPNCHWATHAEQVNNRRPPKRKHRSALAELERFAASLARASIGSQTEGDQYGGRS
jgi:hypothetical protein